MRSAGTRGLDDGAPANISCARVTIAAYVERAHDLATGLRQCTNVALLRNTMKGYGSGSAGNTLADGCNNPLHTHSAEDPCRTPDRISMLYARRISYQSGPGRSS